MAGGELGPAATATGRALYTWTPTSGTPPPGADTLGSDPLPFIGHPGRGADAAPGQRCRTGCRPCQPDGLPRTRPYGVSDTERTVERGQLRLARLPAVAGRSTASTGDHRRAGQAGPDEPDDPRLVALPGHRGGIATTTDGAGRSTRPCAWAVRVWRPQWSMLRLPGIGVPFWAPRPGAPGDGWGTAGGCDPEPPPGAARGVGRVGHWSTSSNTAGGRPGARAPDGGCARRRLVMAASAPCVTTGSTWPCTSYLAPIPPIPPPGLLLHGSASTPDRVPTSSSGPGRVRTGLHRSRCSTVPTGNGAPPRSGR